MTALTLRLVAWEATGACNLACAHCRAEARTEPDPGELDTEEARALVDDLADLSRRQGGPMPIIFIISGGEPLLRADIFPMAAYSSQAGLHTVVGTNGTLLDASNVSRLIDAGVRRLSVSLDGPGPGFHDVFRGVPGAYSRAIDGLAEARRQGLPFQINTTVTQRNQHLLPAMLREVVRLEAVTWDLFMLVPTGRGTEEAGISASDYEHILAWAAEQAGNAPVEVKVTCGPHYARIWRQRRAGGAGDGLVNGQSRPVRPPTGCMAGDGFLFVSRIGEVFPCGYLPVSAGNVRRSPLSRIHSESEVLQALRDPDRLTGKCRRCEYRVVCHGCRARAFSASGDYLAEEPLCLWQPKEMRVTAG